MKAGYYSKNPDGSLTCNLCPHRCKIDNNETGTCGVRRNSMGILQSSSYGLISALNQDPIEKKPLYHFYPGSNILSVGSFGCNLKCNFCQNHNISQVSSETLSLHGKQVSPEEISLQTKNLTKNIGLAFTYNEPIVWIEYLQDIASMVKKDGLKTVMISNGYINTLPLNELIPLVDAFNIDLKSFDDNFYVKQTGGSLKPVLRTLNKISSSGKHLEITMLVIPTLNDDIVLFRKMINWISDNCGDKIVLHLSKYFPHYRSDQAITPDDSLIELYNIAREKIYYTYLGNTSITTGRDTICPVCTNTVIERKGYTIERSGLDGSGNCCVCNTRITDFSTF